MSDSKTLAPWSRRSVIGAGIATFAAAAAGCSTTAAPRSAGRLPMRFDDPVWNREVAARLQADTNGEQVYGRCTGVVCGVRPGEAVRTLLGFEVFSTIRVLRQPDGSYDRMSKETIFYTDPRSGEILDVWDNPYTGERVRVVDVANDPYNWVIRDYIGTAPVPGVDVKAAPPPPLADRKPFLMHWQQFNEDTVTVTEDFHGYYPNRLDPKVWVRESSGAYAQTSELFRYFIRRDQLEDPSVTFLPANGSWVRVTPWLPWMLMGQAPGHIMYDGIFAASKSLDFHKPAVLARIRAKYPQYMTAPTQWYGPSLSSLEHYVLEQKPAPIVGK